MRTWARVSWNLLAAIVVGAALFVIGALVGGNVGQAILIAGAVVFFGGIGLMVSNSWYYMVGPPAEDLDDEDESDVPPGLR